MRAFGDRGDRLDDEGLPENGRVLDELALHGLEAVDARRDERVQRLRHRERVDLADDPIRAVRLLELPAVHEHPHRLDGVERDSLGAGADCGSHLLRQARDEAVQERLHRVGRQRLERQAREAAARRRAERGSLLGELGSREPEDEDRLGARPLHEVLDEVEQAGICPLEILEHEDRRLLIGERLDEEAPRREEILALVARVREPEELRESRFDPVPVVRARDVLRNAGRELRQRFLGALVLEDLGAAADHLRERPVGDTLAVRRAAAAMPPRGQREAVEVLLELPREPRLADPARCR